MFWANTNQKIKDQKLGDCKNEIQENRSQRTQLRIRLGIKQTTYNRHS